jgi:riboflavin synthase
MFTGIIEHVGRIDALELSAAGGRLRVDAGPLAASLAISGSIAVNGCCLTVVERSGSVFAADLSSETLQRTAFGEMKPGARVNLERPLAAGKELGGHFVQGHVDGVGRIVRLEADGVNWWLGVRLPAELERYVAMKGSIAIDGISLTVANVDGARIDAAIIPFTYAHTNLHKLAVGHAVNIETDILAKYVEKLMQTGRTTEASPLTLEHLVQEGF